VAAARDHAPGGTGGRPLLSPVGPAAAAGKFRRGGPEMTVSAYILIQTEVGKAASVASEARKIQGVVSADDVTGPYDVVVIAESENMDELGRMVVSQVQAVDGIVRTTTCPVVKL